MNCKYTEGGCLIKGRRRWVKSQKEVETNICHSERNLLLQ